MKTIPTKQIQTKHYDVNILTLDISKTLSRDCFLVKRVKTIHKCPSSQRTMVIIFANIIK